MHGDDPRQVADTLAGYQRRVTAALHDRLTPGEPRRHLYDLLTAYADRGGKALRPALAFATCAALGGDEDAALPVAVGVELLHESFLVHDDVQDGSLRRRGGPSLPAQWGVGLALCVGDLLAVEATAALRDAARAMGHRGEQVMDEVDTAVRRTIEGQAIELGWEHDRRLDVTEADYLEMVLHKTAWYSVVLPCRLGALAARAPTPPERFLRFGAYLGAVLQIGDDLLGLLGAADVSGKDNADDVLEGKRTLPVIHCLASAPPGSVQPLVEILTCPRQRRHRDDIGWVVRLLTDHGSIDYARGCVDSLAAAARDELEREFCGTRSSPHLSFLTGLVDALAARARP